MYHMCDLCGYGHSSTLSVNQFPGNNTRDSLHTSCCKIYRLMRYLYAIAFSTFKKRMMPLKINKNPIYLPYQGTGLSVPLPLLVPASVLVAATRSPLLDVFDNDATSFSKLDILCCILEIFASYSFSDAFILLRNSVSDVKFFALSSVICNYQCWLFILSLLSVSENRSFSGILTYLSIFC